MHDTHGYKRNTQPCQQNTQHTHTHPLVCLLPSPTQRTAQRVDAHTANTHMQHPIPCLRAHTLALSPTNATHRGHFINRASARLHSTAQHITAHRQTAKRTHPYPGRCMTPPPSLSMTASLLPSFTLQPYQQQTSCQLPTTLIMSPSDAHVTQA